MDRREFHKAALAGLIAAASAAGGTVNQSSAGEAVALLSHPGDALPPGAKARFGTTRFWHFVEKGNDGLNSLAFSPDGRTLAALGYQDDHISLWEVPSGRMLRKWEAGEADRCGELAFSPCSRFLACGSNDGVRMWDSSTGNLVRVFADHPRARSNGVAFSPDGQLLAAALELEGTIEVWNTITGNLVTRLEGDPHPIASDDVWKRSDHFYSVSFSLDGLLIGAGSQFHLFHELTLSDHGAFQKFDQDCIKIAHLMSIGQREAAVELQTAMVPKYQDHLDKLNVYHQMATKYGGYTIRGWGGKDYLAEPRGRVWCWELATGRTIGKWEGHEFPVARVRFIHDGRLVSCGQDGAVWVWDVQAGQKVQELRPSANSRYQTLPAFSADGRTAVLYDPDHFVEIDFIHGVEGKRMPFQAPWKGWANTALSADGRWFAYDYRGRISLWDVTTGQDASPLGRHSGHVSAVSFSADGRYLVSAANQEAFRWDVSTGQHVGSLDFKRLRCGFGSSLAISPEGSRMALSRWGPANQSDPPEPISLMIWEWNGQVIQECPDLAPSATAWTPDGAKVLVGTSNGMVGTVDTATGQWHMLLSDLPSPIQAVAVSPNGRTGAALVNDRELYLCNLAGSKWRNRLETGDHPPPKPRQYMHESRSAIEFSPDSRSIMLATHFGCVFMAAIKDQIMPLRFTVPTVEDEELHVMTAGFAPSGRLLVVGGLKTIVEEAGQGCSTGMTCVWDGMTGEVLWTDTQRNDSDGALAISPDGRTLATGAYNGTTLLWDLGSLVGRLS